MTGIDPHSGIGPPTVLTPWTHGARAHFPHCGWLRPWPPAVPESPGLGDLFKAGQRRPSVAALLAQDDQDVHDVADHSFRIVEEGEDDAAASGPAGSMSSAKPGSVITRPRPNVSCSMT
jgi:hypothetical protein